jgi:hypothetical protein
MFTTRFARHRRAKFRAALLHSRGFALHRGIAESARHCRE